MSQPPPPPPPKKNKTWMLFGLGVFGCLGALVVLSLIGLAIFWFALKPAMDRPKETYSPERSIQAGMGRFLGLCKAGDFADAAPYLGLHDTVGDYTTEQGRKEADLVCGQVRELVEGGVIYQVQTPALETDHYRCLVHFEEPAAGGKKSDSANVAFIFKNVGGDYRISGLDLIK